MNKDFVSIEISRIIYAELWRLVRFITKIENFPEYIPTIIETKVLSKRHNIIETYWKVKIDNVPIQWKEEDKLLLGENRIVFKLQEGDLDCFFGQWQFHRHPEGTKVTIKANLGINIPGFGKFASQYLEKVLKKNFENILDAAETHLISQRYKSYQKGNKEKIAGFGIIGHLYNFYHLAKCIRKLNPDFKMPSREFLKELYHITPSFKLYDIKNFTSSNGSKTEGCFIVATFIPDLMEKDLEAIFSKVVRAIKVAEKHGVGIVTLGGLTSIVAEKMGIELKNYVDVPVTTGNTFTAAMVVEGVREATKFFQRDLSSLKVTIVGGTGDIGSACARVLAAEVRELIITGRTKANLKKIYKELKNKKAKLSVGMDNYKAVRDADIVIAAAAVSASILDINWFKKGAIIADVGYPKNISYKSCSRDDIFVFAGGLSTTPTPLSLPVDMGLSSDNIIYGCFAEGIILALERRYENFSFGRGNITPEKMEEIKTLGKKHGFNLAPFYWGDKRVDKEAPAGAR